MRGILVLCVVSCVVYYFRFRNAYEKAVKGISKALVGHSEPSHITFLGTRFGLGSSPLTPYMDHLSCFYPGMLALGVMNDVAPSMKGLAENLTYTCYYMYNSTEETGLSPESFIFNADPGSRKDFKPAHVSVVKFVSLIFNVLNSVVPNPFLTE